MLTCHFSLLASKYQDSHLIKLFKQCQKRKKEEAEEWRRGGHKELEVLAAAVITCLHQGKVNMMGCDNLSWQACK